MPIAKSGEVALFLFRNKKLVLWSFLAKNIFNEFSDLLRANAALFSVFCND